MSRQQLGVLPERATDTATVDWSYLTYPGHSTYVSTGVDLTVALPDDPADHQMEIIEVYATAPVTVSMPSGVALTSGTSTLLDVKAGKTAFFGFRYSHHAAAWFLLSATVQTS